LLVSISAVLLVNCGESISEEAPPPGCFALVFYVERDAPDRTLRATEAYARGIRGENPYPEDSFAMAKGVSGATVYRSTRKKAGVNPEAVVAEARDWLGDNEPDFVRVTLVE